jgi:anti-sigma factor RsiW
MSHLGDRVSALIDGELTGAELDRANAHLASCDRCRSEAAALRALKRELRSLGGSMETEAEAATVRRLIAATGPGGPLPPRRPLGRGRSGGPRRASVPRQENSRQTSPRRENSRHTALLRKPRRAYTVAGVVSIAVVSLGAAAFTVGGSTGEPEPKVTPNMQIYTIEHAITTGDVPIPSQSGSGFASSQP